MLITGPFRNIQRQNWYLRVSMAKEGPDGPKIRRWRPHYATKDKALADIPRLRSQVSAAGTGHSIFSREIVSDVETARSIAPEISLADAAHFWRRHHPLQPRKKIRDWLPAFLDDIARRLGHTKHLIDLRWRCRRLCDKFGDRDPQNLTRLEALVYLKSMPCAGRTILNHQRAAANFFNFMISSEAAEKNPFAGIKRRELPRIEHKEVGFLSLNEVEKYLRTCEEFDHELVAHEAIQFFAGVRAEDEMKRFRGEWILPATREVVIPSAAAKTGVREVINSLEENFWRWWKKYGRTGPLRPPSYFKRWRRIRILAAQTEIKSARELARLPLEKLLANPAAAIGLKAWPFNARRRTFCTYHVAKYQSAARTALILRHRGSASTLHESYRGLGVTQAQGNAYFNLLPKK